MYVYFKSPIYVQMCEGQSGWLGTALASSISGMAREEAGVAKPVANGWLCSLKSAYACNLDNGNTLQRENFVGTIGTESSVEHLPMLSYKSKTADHDI